MTPSQQLEMDHLQWICSIHPNAQEFAERKARDLAQEFPKRWGWLPAALATQQSSSSNEKPDELQPMGTAGATPADFRTKASRAGTGTRSSSLLGV